MFTLYKKEFLSYLNSWVAYIIIGLFLLVLSLFLWVFPDTSILEYGYASLESMFGTAPYLLMFLIPAITMRSLAEEFKEATFEILATKPITDWQIIAAKYLSGLTVLFLTLLPTLIYYFSIYDLGATKGNIDTGAVIGSYLGLFLLGGIFLAIGIFTSSLTQNQIIAFALALFLCFFMFSGFESISKIGALTKIESKLLYLGINEHYQAISRGVLDTRDAAYFLSCIAIFLCFTKLKLGARKW